MVSYDFSKLRTPRDKRLATEHIKVDEVCSKSHRISYEVLGDWGKRKPPTGYVITYQVRSIIGIKDNFYPVYGDEHTVEINLPQGYPMTSTAKCKMTTEIWHPNVKSSGQFKGRICTNSKEFGKHYQLDELILRIGEILQYKNYHAANTAPFPEDEKVAKWVREFAEPQDIVNNLAGIVVDASNLIEQEDEYYQEEYINDDQSGHEELYQEEDHYDEPEQDFFEEEPKVKISIRPKNISIRPRQG